MKNLLPPSEVAEMIRAGKTLLLAGDEALLTQLPEGQWIGGTSANFMTSEGGLDSREKIFVTDLSSFTTKVRLETYDENTIRRLGAHYPVKGFSFIIIPSGSDLHLTFARDVMEYTGIKNGILAGWISGVHPDEIGQKAAKVFAGKPEALANKACVLHVTLHEGYTAKMETLNLFTPDPESPSIVFSQTGFEITENCLINGESLSLPAYIKEKNIDTKLPLITTMGGIETNVSIQKIDEEKNTVSLYAPVFRNTEYRFARQVDDYIKAFNKAIEERGTGHPAFSCNCILNYLYADLKGKKTEGFEGPITFGEIAYHLLNQTLVYLTVEKTAG